MVDYDPDYIFWTDIYMASSWLIVIQCSLQIFHVFKGGVCFGWAVVVLGVVATLLRAASSARRI